MPLRVKDEPMGARKKWILILILLGLTDAQAQVVQKPSMRLQSGALSVALMAHYLQPASYDWTKVVRIDIDRQKYPFKYKVVAEVLQSMAEDASGRQILEHIRLYNSIPVSIKDKEAVLVDNKSDSVQGTFSADYGLQVIRPDMRYNAMDNELVLDFEKSGQMLCFDEEKHLFFKLSLNSVIAAELERAGETQPEAVLRCRALLAHMAPDEQFLFQNYKDLMGEKFTEKEIERCRQKKITIHDFHSGKDIPYTFTDSVTDALLAFHEYAASLKENAYAIDSRIMPLARQYTDLLGEPHHSAEPVFTVRLGQNRARPLQFGPVTGTDYLVLHTGQHNVYQNFSVFYDTNEGEKLDNPTALKRIREEYVTQLRHNTELLHSAQLLEYVDRLKKYFNKDYQPARDYETVKKKAVEKVMAHNPYLEGADKVIEAEMIWTMTNGQEKHQ